MNKNNMILVGFMGTGKTTVGRVIAERLGWKFVDVDSALEEKEGRTIPEIFGSQGEDYFREAETRALKELLDGEHHVVSTGGGAVLAETNRKMMKEQGRVVALTASAETIIERVRHDTNRPLLQGGVEARVHKLLAERRDAYDFADLTVHTDGLDAERIASIILESAQPGLGKER